MSDKDIQPNVDHPALTVTYETPHPADETSAPGPYEGLEADRPPVSTTDADTPIAQTLAAGAGAHTPPKDEAAQLARNAMKRDGEQIVPTAGAVEKPAKA
jgi:hypothetical protein